MAATSHPSGLAVTQWRDICDRHRESTGPTLPLGETAIERPSCVKDGLENCLWEQAFITGSAPRRMAHGSRRQRGPPPVFLFLPLSIQMTKTGSKCYCVLNTFLQHLLIAGCLGKRLWPGLGPSAALSEEQKAGSMDAEVRARASVLLRVL